MGIPKHVRRGLAPTRTAGQASQRQCHLRFSHRMLQVPVLHSTSAQSFVARNSNNPLLSLTLCVSQEFWKSVAGQSWVGISYSCSQMLAETATVWD